MGGHDSDDRPGGRATDRIQAHVQAGLLAEVADARQQRGARASLVGAERRPSRHRDAQAQIRHQVVTAMSTRTAQALGRLRS